MTDLDLWLGRNGAGGAHNFLIGAGFKLVKMRSSLISTVTADSDDIGQTTVGAWRDECRSIHLIRGIWKY